MKGTVGTGGTALTCSITSGAIQHGVPTNVFLTLFLVMSPPVAKKALTPKSSGGKEDNKTINRLTQGHGKSCITYFSGQAPPIINK